MGVNKSGQDNSAGGIKLRGGLEIVLASGLSDFHDPAVFHRHETVLVDGPVRVHRNHRAVLDQKVDSLLRHSESAERESD